MLDKISALMGDGIHDADLMLWFSQARPVNVYAQEIHPGTNKFPDGGWAMFRLDNGAIGVVESIWYLPETTPYQIDARMELSGPREPFISTAEKLACPSTITKAPSCPIRCTGRKCLANDSGSCAELRYFADCIIQGRRPERITPQESRDAVALMAAATRSAQTGQIVELV